MTKKALILFAGLMFVSVGSCVAHEARAEQVSISTFSLKVNYDLSVGSLVAHGKYDWKSNNITSKNFPTTRKGEVDLTIELVHFNKVLTTEEVIAELNKKGLRPAKLHELLSFGEKYPEEQGKYPVIALGSVWQYRRARWLVPYLHGDVYVRILGLVYFGHKWDAHSRFLAVRES